MKPAKQDRRGRGQPAAATVAPAATTRAPRSGGPPAAAGTRRRGRLAVVYDVDGPRIRLGVTWFAGALAGVAAGPATTALVYGAAAGWAAYQIVKAWGSVTWQAQLAAGLGVAPVLAALVGVRATVVLLVAGVVVAAGAALAPSGARLAGRGGRAAAFGILCLAIVPAVGAGSMVLVRAHSLTAALVLLTFASAYEIGDYIVGSGASNAVEGPLAGIATAVTPMLPLAVLLVDPFDGAGIALIAFAAAACPLGQFGASVLLPDAGAAAPALRRIDTLLVLAPLWAAASGAF